MAVSGFTPSTPSGHEGKVQISHTPSGNESFGVLQRLRGACPGPAEGSARMVSRGALK